MKRTRHHPYRLLLLTVLLVLQFMLIPLLAQRRGRGGGAQHRRGFKMQDFHDRNGDGIDDRFQDRYRQKRLKKLVEDNYTLIRQVMSLPEKSRIDLVCKAGDIPGLEKDGRAVLESKGYPKPPEQYATESDKTLTVFYTWHEDGGSLYRWDLIQAENKTIALDGTLLETNLGDARPQPASAPLPVIHWPTAKQEP